MKPYLNSGDDQLQNRPEIRTRRLAKMTDFAESDAIAIQKTGYSHGYH